MANCLLKKFEVLFLVKMVTSGMWNVYVTAKDIVEIPGCVGEPKSIKQDLKHGYFLLIKKLFT
jgi:hypothetical protein